MTLISVDRLCYVFSRTVNGDNRDGYLIESSEYVKERKTCNYSDLTSENLPLLVSENE